MAIDAFMIFIDADGKQLEAESLTKFDADPTDDLIKDDFTAGKVFEIDDFSFDIEQTLNIGSQSGGAGAGKINFNPFQFSRKTDKASPSFFELCCQGKHFKYASLAMRKATGGDASGKAYLRFDFRLAGIKTISWSGSDGDEATKEEVTFEFGAMLVRYKPQNEKGQLDPAKVAGWNRVRNAKDQNMPTVAI